MPHTANSATVDELLLPDCVRDVLAAARAARPGQHLTCISFHTEEDGHQSECMEPDPELIARMTANAASRLHRRNVLVLSVRVTETTFDSVHTRTHVLVTETDLYDRTKAAPWHRGGAACAPNTGRFDVVQ